MLDDPPVDQGHDAAVDESVVAGEVMGDEDEEHLTHQQADVGGDGEQML